MFIFVQILSIREMQFFLFRAMCKDAHPDIRWMSVAIRRTFTNGILDQMTAYQAEIMLTRYPGHI